jgi:hypothetical protein
MVRKIGPDVIVSILKIYGNGLCKILALLSHGAISNLYTFSASRKRRVASCRLSF